MSTLVRRIRLRIAGRIAPVLGVLFMLLAPSFATAQAAVALPNAVRAPAAPTPTPSPSQSGNPCDLIPKELPSREWCEKGAKGQHPDPPGGSLPENPLDALKGDCKSGPVPEVPGDGLLGWIDSGPKTLPPHRDPKAADADAYLYEQYGYAGLRFNTYDLGCAGGLLKAPESASDNWFANKVFTWSKAWTAFTVVLREQATDGGFLKDLNPVIENATHAVRDAVYTPWVGTSIAILGAVLIFQARRRDMNSVMSQAIWALLVMTIATGVASYPVEASAFADNTMDSVIAQVDQAFAKVDLGTTHKTPSSLPSGATGTVTPAIDPDSRLPHSNGAAPAVGSSTAHGNMLVHSTLYQYWLRGTLGSTTSPVARKYGMQLFDAQALTWAESRSPDRDKIAADKQKKFEQIASSIKDEDPTAYDHLTGRADGRLGGAFLSMFSAFATNLFSMLANLVIIGGKLTIKFTVVLFPALAVIGLHRRTDGVVKTALHSVAAACINVPLFAVAGGIDVVAVEALSVGNTNLPAWLSIVLLLLLTWILWRMTKPLRRMSAMVNPNANYMEDAGSAFTAPGRLAKTAGKYWLMSRALKRLRGGHAGGGDGLDDLAEAGAPASEEPYLGGRPGPMPVDEDFGSWWDNGQGMPHSPKSPTGQGGPQGGAGTGLDGTLQSYADYQADTGVEEHHYATGHHDRFRTADPVGAAAHSPAAPLDNVWDTEGWYVDDLDPAASPALPPASNGHRPAASEGGTMPVDGPQPQGPGPAAPAAPASGGDSNAVPPPRSRGGVRPAPPRPSLPAHDGTAAPTAPEGDRPYHQEDPGPQVVPPAVDPDSDGVYVIYRPDQGYTVQDDSTGDDLQGGEQR